MQPFTEAAQQAISRAHHLAVARQSSQVEAAHLFLGLLPPENEESLIPTLLQVSGVAREEVELYAASALENETHGDAAEPKLSPDAKRIIRMAMSESNRHNAALIGPEHLFIACIAHQRGPHLGEVLRPLGLDAAQLRQHLRGLNQAKTPYRAGNPLNSLTEQGERAIAAAHAAMRASFCGQISTSHLLLGLLSDENFGSVEMHQLTGIHIEDLKRRARETVVSDGQIATPQKKFSPGAKRALERAKVEATRAGYEFIACEYLLLALLPQPEGWSEKLVAGNQNLDSVAHLWTSAQAEALRATLAPDPVESAVDAPNPNVVEIDLKALPSWVILGLLTALLCANAMGAPSFGNSAGNFVFATVAVLLMLGLRIGVAVSFRRSLHLVNACLGLGCGWVLGMAAGFYWFYQG